VARKSRSPSLRELDAQVEADTQKRLAHWHKLWAGFDAASIPALAPISDEECISRLVEAGYTGPVLNRLKAAVAARERATKRRDEVNSRRAEIVRLNGEGMNDFQIAAAMGMSRPHVCRLRAELGIPAVKRQRNG